MQLAPDVVVAERFRLSRQLGRGGMGSVWLATHLGLDVPCAVKFIEGEYAQVPEAQARFEREAKAAASLRSPHVVQILDHGVFEGTPYIAMELLDGEELGKRLQRVGRLPPREVLRVVNQVGRALAKAHSIGIVHRDLKPENIFLVHDDDREIAKVLDFGIAKSKGSGIDGSNTKTGAMLGTPYYMSPEQAQGTKAVDHRSDLWALGVIVFQALTGRLPFESEALGDLLVKIIVSPIPMPSEFASDLPPALDAWWSKASQRDPAARFQSAKELTDSLALALGASKAGELGESLSGLGSSSGMLSAQAAGSLAMTPQPFGMTPQPLGLTPPPGTLGGLPGTAGGLLPTTPSPTSHTFAGTPLPKQRTGLFVAIGGGVLATALIVIVGVSVASKGKREASGSNVGSNAPTAALVPPGPVAAAPTAPSPPASAVVLPALEALPQPSSMPAPSVHGEAAAPPAAVKGHAQAATFVPAARPAAPPPPAPSKKQKVDLGI